MDAIGAGERGEVRMPLEQLGQALIAAGLGDEAVRVLTRARALDEKLFGVGKETAAGDVLLARALLVRHGEGDREAAGRRVAESVAVFARLQPGGKSEAEARALLQSLGGAPAPAHS